MNSLGTVIIYFDKYYHVIDMLDKFINKGDEYVACTTICCTMLVIFLRSSMRLVLNYVLSRIVIGFILDVSITL